MPAKLLFLIGILTVSYLAIQWFINTSPQKIAQILRRSAIYLVIALLLFLIVTGRLHWIIALIGGLLPLARKLLPLLRSFATFKHLFQQYQQRPWQQSKSSTHSNVSSPPPTSEVTSAYLQMTLDHETGLLAGKVLQGQYQGHSLADISLLNLQEFFTELQNIDQDSAALLASYLTQTYGDQWQQTAQDHQPSDTNNNSTMSPQQAYEILGLQPGADEAQIKQAHHRLIQKIHPDRGGSSYLAAQINLAKDLLLKSKRPNH